MMYRVYAVLRVFTLYTTQASRDKEILMYSYTAAVSLHVERCIGVGSALRVHGTPGGLDGLQLIGSCLNKALGTGVGR